MEIFQSTIFRYFQAQFVKCQQLLDGGQKEVFLHGIGDAIPRALNLAAKLRDQYKGSLDFSVTTSTIKLVGKTEIYLNFAVVQLL